MIGGTKKILVNLLCAFVPSKATRHKIRDKFLYSNLHPIPTNISDLYRQLKFEIEKASYLTRMDFAAAQLHPKTFGKYKNAFNGRDVVLVATGPSLNNFKPIDGAIYVGVNGAFKYDKVKLDYLFCCDLQGVNYIEEMKDYPAVKFFGILREKFLENGLINESVSIRHNALRYYEDSPVDPVINGDLDFVYDITTRPLANYASIVFPATQFILWGNPKRIFLVGCDTNENGYFDGKESRLNVENVIIGWQKLKEFAHAYYPETEIISINPVGLKGMFNDQFQNEDYQTFKPYIPGNKRVIKSSRNEKNLFLYASRTSNAGDLASCPLRYFSFPGENIEKDLWSSVNSGEQIADNIVVGGGDNMPLEINKMYYERLNADKNLIAWGNRTCLMSPSALNGFLDKCALYGTRDFNSEYIDNNKVFYVPCSSCMNSVFDISYTELKYKAVFFLHGNFKGFEDTGDIPVMTNYMDMVEIVKFLSSAEIVMTNSYHGLYWATLLGKRVICFPVFNNKFYGIKWTPVYSEFGDWRKALANAEKIASYPNAKDECRELNMDFYKKVLDRVFNI